MASPFVPVPPPLDRASDSRRPLRTSSLGSFSSSHQPSSSSTRALSEDRGRGVSGGGTLLPVCRSHTPLPACQSPVTRARLNGLEEPSVEYSSSSYPLADPPLSYPGPALSQDDQDRPITPTILGYEVMEERAKFTVYKILVRKTPEEGWVVFRRYADFSRLNEKLKEMFPGFRLALPPKRWFKDNYDTDFLEDRQLGLQAFLQNLVAHKDIANCLTVREFLCLDDPPGPFDSLEESRAFCETLEESNYRLQRELLDKQREISALRRRLEEREQRISQLERDSHGECLSPESLYGLGSGSGSAPGSDSSVEADGEQESSTAAADQEITENSSSCEALSLHPSVCWCGPPTGSSPPTIQVTQVCDLRLEH